MNTQTQTQTQHTPATPITEAGIYPPSRTSNGPLLVRAAVARNLELSRADLLAVLSRIEYLTSGAPTELKTRINDIARAAISRAKGQGGAMFALSF